MSLTTEEKVKILDIEILVKEDMLKMLQSELKLEVDGVSFKETEDERIEFRKRCKYLIALLREEKFRLSIRG